MFHQYCAYVYINVNRGHFYVNRGQSPAEADLNLLETARRCELYGMKMHPAKVGDIKKFITNSRITNYIIYVQLYLYNYIFIFNII